MTYYYLTEWEHNGRDDSDWYLVYFDSETNKLGRHCFGTTRFAFPPSATLSFQENGFCGHTMNGIPILYPDSPMLERARVVLVRDHFIPIITAQYERRINDHPPVADLHKGLRLKLVEDTRNKVTEFDQIPCDKCTQMPGKWINPKNPNDIRMCFACGGLGFKKSNLRPKKEEGKTVWNKIKAGIVGTVIDWRIYGTFYANGYKQPGGRDTYVILALDDGTQIKALLNKLRRCEEMPSLEEIKQKAEKWANSGGNNVFYYPFRTSGLSLI